MAEFYRNRAICMFYIWRNLIEILIKRNCNRGRVEPPLFFVCFHKADSCMMSLLSYSVKAINIWISMIKLMCVYFSSKTFWRKISKIFFRNYSHIGWEWIFFETKIHEIAEWVRLEWTTVDNLIQPPCSGHVTPDHMVQDCVQTLLHYLHTLSEQSGPMLSHLHSEEVLPYIMQDFLCISLGPLPLVLLLGWEEPGSNLLTPSLRYL